MSDVNYQMLVEIGGIMDGTVPREGICTTADGVRWLCDRVQELKNELYETKRERDKAMKDAVQLADRLSRLELRTTEELARLERELNEARKETDL
jgi:predicted ribosome quality control (RQC) complex YloA/Tae2 family protein